MAKQAGTIGYNKAGSGSLAENAFKKEKEMDSLDMSQWTKEERIAFEVWLSISIELIEKYSSIETD